MKNQDYIDSLNFRYATKKFDAYKNLSTQQLEDVKEAIQLTASSYGLQPYEVFIIEDTNTREKLKEVSYGQPQITDSSQLIVFAVNTKIDENYLDNYIKNISETRNVSVESLQEMRDTIAGTTLQMDQEAKTTWAQKQAYIALGNLLSAVAFYGFDACPMEGFENEKYNEILGLKDKNLHATVIATIGYRSDEDELQHAAKVRKPKNELFTHI